MHKTLPPTLLSPWPQRPTSGVLLMGIVNVTPDSFSDGGQFDQVQAAVAQAHRLAGEGADIIDIGGESTRPFAEPVHPEEEIARVLPVLEALRAQGFTTPISIDTYRGQTAKAALNAGAQIVNDVWGLQRDGAMADIVAEAGAGLVVMHNREEKDEAVDICADMLRFFEHSLGLADKAGIDRARIALDPGIGFGKSFEQNLAAIRAIPQLKALGFPVLLGVSRKSFLGLITGRPVGDRLSATIAADVMGVMLGADILRVHDVAPHHDAIRVTAALAR
jgi:dihydropteroate synthase